MSERDHHSNRAILYGFFSHQSVSQCPDSTISDVSGAGALCGYIREFNVLDPRERSDD